MRIEDLSYINSIKKKVFKKEPFGSLIEKLVFHFFIIFKKYLWIVKSFVSSG